LILYKGGKQQVVRSICITAFYKTNNLADLSVELD